MNDATDRVDGELLPARWLIAGLLFWTLLLTLPLLNFTVYPARGKYLLMSKEIGWKIGYFQGARGRILDRDGQILVWSERQFDLESISPLSPARREALTQILQTVFLRPPPPLPDRPGTICRNLEPDQLHRFIYLMNQAPELHLSARSIRRYLSPELIGPAGELKVKRGIANGNSGWEERYDRRLRGRTGFFTVMTDRHGNWIPVTWKRLKAPLPGQDVVLELSAEEILRQARKKP